MPRTEKTAREILEKLVYRTQNLMGRSQSEEIDQALLELQEVIVPEEEKGRFVVEAQDGGHWVTNLIEDGWNQHRTEVLTNLGDVPEELEPIVVDIGVGEMESSYEKGFNTARSLMLPLIVARDRRIEELEDALKRAEEVIKQCHQELNTFVLKQPQKVGVTEVYPTMGMDMAEKLLDELNALLTTRGKE